VTTPAHVATVPVTREQAEETSVWPFGLALGMSILVVGLSLSPWLVALGVLVTLASTAGWVRENMRHHLGVATGAAAPGAYPRTVLPDPEQEEGRSKWWWGTLWLIVTESGLFVAALLTLTAHHVLHDPSAPAPFRELNTVRALVASLVLWSSGGTAYLAMRALRRGKLARFQWLMAATILLGLAFLGYQAHEYLSLAREGFTLSSGAAASIFFVTTGLHGAHVLGGVVILAVVMLHAARGGIRPQRRAPAEAATLYWHFVDAVWIAIYGILYLKLL
jgi:heme/copper-type cytochrome/quinol oxidase subunit 3